MLDSQIIYGQQQQMENGFTASDSKGLFTFYRQQNQLQKRKGKLHMSSLQSSNPVKKHYVSLSNYNNSQQGKYKSENNNSKPLSQRYDQIKQQLQVKQTFTPKNVLTINFRKSLKNQFYFQLISNKGRRNRTEIQSYFKEKVSVKDKQTNLLKNLSVKEIPANTVKQMFKPKKQCLIKYQNSKKNPLRMNAVSAHCISDNPRNLQEQKIFHMPIIKPTEPNRAKNKLELGSTLCKEVFVVRKRKLENNTFWQEIKQRKSKREVNIVNLNNKIEQWTKQEALKASSGITIQQLLKQ